MTLTVPRSNRDPGRAAEIRVPDITTGAAFAQFGDVMADVGLRLEREEQGRALGQAKLDYQRGLNDLDIELRQTNDPNVIDRDFPARAGALRDQLLQNLPQHIRENAGMELDALAEPRRYAMGRHALDLRQSFRRVMLNDLQSETVRGATMLDAQGRGSLLEEFARTVQENVMLGVLTPEQGQAMVLDAHSGMGTSTARRLLRANPEALLAELEAGLLFEVDEDARQQWMTRATSVIETEQKAQEQAATRAQRERDQEIAAELSDAARILKEGQLPERVDEFSASPEYVNHPAAEDFGRALMLFEQRPDFLRQPPRVMRAMLREEEARPKRNAGELDITRAMREALAEAERAWNDDPITYSAEIGLGAPPALPDDITAANIGELAEALVQRAHYADSLLGDAETPGWVDQSRLFSNEERDALTELADPTVAPPQRAKLAASFAVAFGDQAVDRIEEIGGDPLFAYVGGMVANGGSERLARDIFEGQRRLDDGAVPLPSRPQRRQSWYVNFEGLFDDELESGMRDQVIAAADALYARRASGNRDRSDGAMSERDYMQAVHEVLGGQGQYGSTGLVGRVQGVTPRGGVQVINGRPTLLPTGVAGRDVENVWRNLGVDLFDAGMNAENLTNVDGQARAILQDISVRGPAPSFGGQGMTSNTWENTTLRAIGNGAYALIYEHPELGETTAYDENGDVYLLDLRRLLARGLR